MSLLCPPGFPERGGECSNPSPAMAAFLYLCDAVTFLNWDTVGRLDRPANHLSDFKSIWLIIHERLPWMPLKGSDSCWGSVEDGLS